MDLNTSVYKSFGQVVNSNQIDSIIHTENIIEESEDDFTKHPIVPIVNNKVQKKSFYKAKIVTTDFNTLEQNLLDNYLDLPPPVVA